MFNKDFTSGYNYIQEVKKEQTIARLKQKLIGLATIACGAISVPALEMDITGAIFLIPIGLYLVFSSEVFLDL